MIDLRSDTVTRPSRELRAAMAAAEVGDDVYGEDPTVRALEEATAALLGKEAGVLVTSGTQANQCALLATTRSGDEIWAHEAAHVVTAEQAGAAVLARVQTRTFRGARGELAVDELEGWQRDGRDVHEPRTRLLWLENTIGIAGGLPIEPSRMRELCAFAERAGMLVHVDGARLWDAAVATGLPEHELVRDAHTVSVCFSKSLGAPIGSLVAGPADVIARVRRARKLLGGGMRQAGVIAAAAHYAVIHHRGRLADNHDRAVRLAEGLATLDGLHVDPRAVTTSMVLGRTAARAAPRLAAEISAAGVGCCELSHDVVRFVVHLDIDDHDIERAIPIIRAAVTQSTPEGDATDE